MRKTKKQKIISRRKKAVSENSAVAPIDVTKRNTLSTISKTGLSLVAIGAAGAYFYQAYKIDLKERDLTRIGKGKPTIVQIHDPNCQLCTALQKQARKAVSNFEDEDLNFLVANIRTTKGREFANKHNVPHVTLLLFSKRGQLRNVLQGVRQEEELTSIFKSLLDSS